jgi:hypothetical protein
LTNGKTSDSQTIDSITSNNNTNIELPFQNNDHNKPNNPTTLMKLITPITQRRNNQTGITNNNINLMRVQVQNQCDRTGGLASITYVRDVQGSLGGDKRHDAGRVTVVCGKPKCSHSLRSAR